MAIDGPPELMRISKGKKILPERGERPAHTSELFGIEETFPPTLLEFPFSLGDFQLNNGIHYPPSIVLGDGLLVVDVVDPLFFPAATTAFRYHVQPHGTRVLGNASFRVNLEPC